MTASTSTPASSGSGEPSLPAVMRAASHSRFGGPEVIEIADVDRPEPGAGQVLVAVEAASLNPYDWHFVRGLPYIVRSQAGIRTPKRPIVGADMAGTIVSVGPGVTEFAVGDRVFGGGVGTCAEFALAKPANIAAIPADVTFAAAAGIPMAGCTALQAVRDTAQVTAGDRVLVNGASGGVGLMVVQIARSLGAEVTAVCSGRNTDLVRSVGADAVIDYTTEDFLDTPVRYDAVIDTVMTRSPRAVTTIMTDGGRYALVGALHMGDWIGPIAMWLRPMFASLGRSQRLRVTMATEPRSDLEILASMMDRGELRTVVDSTFPLDETSAALAHLEDGHARGKVIVQVGRR